MSVTIFERIDRRLTVMLEGLDEESWKDPHAESYRRDVAENALFKTIGPLTEQPRWATDWEAPDGQVYAKGSPAPHWSQHELTIAIAGDPKYLERDQYNPRSPMYGGKFGGAPLWRWAREIARNYKKPNDMQFILDLYQLGMVQLTHMMQPGFDMSIEPFISYVTRSVKGAMENGVGGSNQARSALGAEAANVAGLGKLLQAKTGDQARKFADQVKGKYQTTKSYDKSDENPFAQYSSAYFKAANDLADALDAENEAAINRAQLQISQLQDQIRDESEHIPGAATGLGQAIDTPDRKRTFNVGSIDEPFGGDSDAGSIGQNLPDRGTGNESPFDPETLQVLLHEALFVDYGAALPSGVAGSEYNPGAVKGTLTATEFRYLLRQLGSIASEYPGKGKLRERTDVPREAVGWWKAGEDPEIEPLWGRAAEVWGGDQWDSLWSRGGYNVQGPSEIAVEMTQEVREFNDLGVATNRTIKPKEKKKAGDSASVKQYEEAVSNVAIVNAVKRAMLKIRMVAAVNSRELGLGHDGLDESIKDKLVKAGSILVERVTPADRMIFESANRYLGKLEFQILKTLLG